MYEDDIELVQPIGYKRGYYPVLEGFMIDYKEQVLIISIKANIQYSICHLLLKKRELVTWL